MKTRNYLLRLILRVLRWLIRRKGNLLTSEDLLNAGWTTEIVYDRVFHVEPNVKVRDKVWIEIQDHYYRVYHGEDRTFIDLQATKQWLQVYLYLLDPYGMLDTRKSLIEK